MRPGKIVGVGLNYRDHARESGLPLPDRPLLFAKWPTAVIADGEAIVLPRESAQVDYEAELGVLIGDTLRDATPEDALAAVAGYVCVNDVTARDLQVAEGQWTRAKSVDTFCPVGAPVAAAAVADPQALIVRCLLNGEVVQSSSTAEMVFRVAELIAYASRGTRLEPGDLLITGTPAGVGMARERLLRPGDEVVVEIEGVGRLANPVIAA
jgi:2-keto-4-pentenoate hydratase/2-oxohepta-3-ene-1,7-dioic acid hydratase in catechol pathway